MTEPTWTVGDEAVLWSISLGMALQPWLMGLLPRLLPEPLPDREDHT